VGILVWGLIVLLFEPLGLLRYRIAVSVQIIFILFGWFILRRVSPAQAHVQFIVIFMLAEIISPLVFSP